MGIKQLIEKPVSESKTTEIDEELTNFAKHRRLLSVYRKPQRDEAHKRKH